MTLPDTNALQAWLGREVSWQGLRYQVIEILDDGPALVLESTHAGHHIQTDAHGRPRREARDTILIRVLDHDRREPHQDFVALVAANSGATGQNADRGSG